MVDMKELRDEPLGYLLHRVTAALRAEVAATVLEPVELAAPEYFCMRMLVQSPKTNAQLARHVDPQGSDHARAPRPQGNRGRGPRPCQAQRTGSARVPAAPGRSRLRA